MKQREDQGDFQSYIVGLGVSIVLMLGAYFVVVKSLFSFPVAVGVLVGLGLISAVTQMLLFMHLGGEERPHWNWLVFGFMVVILCVIVIGSLWIMSNLDYRMM